MGGYYVLCTLSFLFHSSAILLFILPVLKWVKVWDMMRVNRYTILLLLLILMVGYAIQNIFFDYINILSFTDRIESRVNVYSESSLAGNVFNVNGILTLVFRYVLYPFFAIVFLKRRRNMERITIEPMITLCLIFAILSIPIAIFYRYNNYFMPFAILALANISFSRKVFLTQNKFVNIHSFGFWILLYIPMFFFQFYGYFSNVRNTRCKEYMRYYPYNSILDKERDMDREALFIFYNAY
ncbi:EpsG family protein [Bacteroides thetaiotaomicron]|nr:EpsG family protein [Bacteroides thetaiotaomicron]